MTIDSTSSFGTQADGAGPLVRHVPRRIETVAKLLVTVPHVKRNTTNDSVLQIFEAHPEFHALPVVEDSVPEGIIHRHRFVELFVRPYYREIHGKRPCTLYMDAHPLLIESSLTLEDFSETLVESDQRYLTEGFIICERGRYAGLGRSQDLIREMTRLRLESARYANPLTLLPGNVPINEAIDQLLAMGTRFVAAYGDLNHFKAYNDVYGYSRGDEMIKLTARVLADAIDPAGDFLGHIGGDDFIALLKSEDWEERCSKALISFDRNARALFDPADLERGGINGEDRRGQQVTFPLTSLAIGAVVVSPGRFFTHLQVSAHATEAKRMAKRAEGSSLFVERRALPE
jgi:GGDEF domain-containing protein